MICQAKSPLAALPPASESRRAGAGARAARGGGRGAVRGAAGIRLRLSRSLPAPGGPRQQSPSLALPLRAWVSLFPSISAATVCPAVSVAAPAFPSQPPLLPECRTTSRSRAVALGAGKPGLGRQRRGAGRGSPSRHHVEFGTALQKRANSDQIMHGLFFFSSLPLLFKRKRVLRAVRFFF